MTLGSLGHTFPTDLMKIGGGVVEKELTRVPVDSVADKQLLTC